MAWQRTHNCLMLGGATTKAQTKHHDQGENSEKQIEERERGIERDIERDREAKIQREKERPEITTNKIRRRRTPCSGGELREIQRHTERERKRDQT